MLRLLKPDTHKQQKTKKEGASPARRKKDATRA
jgi:hypothetical protein